MDFDSQLCESRLFFEDDEVEYPEEAFDPSHSFCKGDRDVEKSFKGFFYFLTNQERFETQNFSDDPVVEESVFTWLEIPIVSTKHTMQI